MLDDNVCQCVCCMKCLHKRELPDRTTAEGYRRLSEDRVDDLGIIIEEDVDKEKKLVHEISRCITVSRNRLTYPCINLKSKCLRGFADGQIEIVFTVL